ncbi:hypothetical protein A2U01_0001655 [Trifolium medium]|uniref:Uncharacterized protein n=1 Tax=Trifolium medium TaxID=97028 RepID=A0A392M0X0_9FABA|nr:hypothetical protein [Trifolium medium]
MSPRAPPQNQQPQPMMPVTSFPVTSGSSGQTIAGQGLRSDYAENQPKNSVFSNALSSPVRRNLQLYQIGEGGNPSFLHNQSRDSTALTCLLQKLQKKPTAITIPCLDFACSLDHARNDKKVELILVTFLILSTWQFSDVDAGFALCFCIQNFFKWSLAED